MQGTKKTSMPCPTCEKRLTSVMISTEQGIKALPYFMACSECKKVYKIELKEVV